MYKIACMNVVNITGNSHRIIITHTRIARSSLVEIIKICSVQPQEERSQPTKQYLPHWKDQNQPLITEAIRKRKGQEN